LDGTAISATKTAVGCVLLPRLSAEPDGAWHFR
jgi:hypothetical protein